jgi:hypothetical protein
MKPIYPGMTAYLDGGGTVRVVDVLADVGTRAECYLVLAAYGVFGPDVVAPCSAVWCVDEHVHLALTVSDLATLPRFEAERYGTAAGLYSRAKDHYHVTAPRHRPA